MHHDQPAPLGSIDLTDPRVRALIRHRARRAAQRRVAVLRAAAVSGAGVVPAGVLAAR